MDIESQISPTVMALTKCKLVEQKAMSELIVDISPKTVFLEYLSDIFPKLSCLNKLMVKITGAWNIKLFNENIESNRSSLKIVGVTVVEDNTPALEFEDAINSVLSCQNIQVVSLSVKFFKGLHLFEFPREICNVSVLSLKSNNERILGLALRRTFLSKLNLEI